MWRWLLCALLFFPLITRSASSNRLLVIGNSITKHGPAEEIGWYGNWGMAATEEANDWVHQVWAALPDGTDLTIMPCLAPDLVARKGELVDLVESVNPTLLVIQVGDNMAIDDASDETLYWPMLHIISAAHSKVVVVGLWGADDVRNDLLQRAAADGGARFVKIDDLRERDGYQAEEFDDPGVAWHPSDLGMAAIAERVLEQVD